MSNTNTGGPAFPVTSDNYANPNSEGMTLRDYFAAKAMQGILSGLLADGQDIQWVEISRNAYWQADSMLEARN